MRDRNQINVGSLTVDATGCVVLSDEDLFILEAMPEIAFAGGGYEDPVPSRTSNLDCTNFWGCEKSRNVGCTNSATCGGSTNSSCH